MAQAAPLIPTASDFAQPPTLLNEAGGTRERRASRSSSSGRPPRRWRGRCLAVSAARCAKTIHTPSASRARRSAISRSNSTAGSSTRKNRPTLLGAILPQIAGWFGSAASYLIPCELVTAPIPDRPAARGRPHGRDPARRGSQGNPGRRLLCLRAALQPGDPAPRRGDRRRLPEELRPAQRLAAAAGGARHDPPPPRLRRSVSAGLCPPMLVSPDYWPDRRRFIDDYLSANPTRNRDLDLLPLLLFFERRAGARAAAEREDQRTARLPLSPARRARERPGLEHRAGLEPVGRRRAAGGRPRAARQRRRSPTSPSRARRRAGRTPSNGLPSS